MKIGDTIIVVKKFSFNKRYYNIGDKFKIVGDSDFRGWDIQDMNGNTIYETMMISDNFEELQLKELRKQKLDKINEVKDK